MKTIYLQAKNEDKSIQYMHSSVVHENYEFVNSLPRYHRLCDMPIPVFDLFKVSLEDSIYLEAHKYEILQIEIYYKDDQGDTKRIRSVSDKFFKPGYDKCCVYFKKELRQVINDSIKDNMYDQNVTGIILEYLGLPK
jgi:hypothetical protein